MTPTHTPLPWHLKLRKVPDDGQTLTLKRDFYEVGAVGPGGGVAFVFGPDGANAALIVRAVNAHADLVAALKEVSERLLGFYQRAPMETPQVLAAQDALRAATLALAKAGAA